MRSAVTMGFWRLTALVALVLPVAACGTTPVVSESTDVAADAPVGTDAEAPNDAAADLDAAPDAVSDAAPDEAAPDAALDMTDAVPGTDAIAVPDAAVDVPPDDAGPIGKSIHATACSADADCNIPCAKGSCVGGACSYVVKGNVCLTPYGAGQMACYGAGLADDITPCLACDPTIATDKLSAISGGAALNGPGEGVAIVDTVNGGIGWNFSTARSVSGGTSLYFGDPTTLNYANGKQVAGTATLPPLPVPLTAGVNPTVSFWLWMDTEASLGYDTLTVNALIGNTTELLWNSDIIFSTTHGSWQRITLDASAFAGQSLTLQFAFDSIDGNVNAFEGVYVDEIEVSTGCCAAASDCDDGNPCSADLCQATSTGTPACVHTPMADCCSTADDCNDGKACTLDTCPVPGGACAHGAVANCCMADTDCDDSDACTIDACSGPGGTCQHQNTCCTTDAECKSADSCFTGSCSAGACVFQSVCCQKADDCDDFNPCTNDICDAGKCVYTASTSPGCCTPVVLSSSFDTGDGGYTITPTAPGGPTWYAKNVTDSVGGTGVLAFGDPNAASYTINGTTKPKAVALSPFVTLLGGKEASLTFSFRADTVSSLLTLRVACDVDGVDTTLASKAISSGSISWQTVTVDLSPLAGKSFGLRFEVTPTSTFGSEVNTQVYLDNVHIDSTCEPESCANTAACAPAFTLSCYTGVCSNGQCSWPHSCCATDTDCDDNVLCTTDKCVSQKCTFTALKNCCMGNSDCNDLNACTADTCAGPGAQCTFTPIAGCCTTNAGCDDNNACTIDICAKNVCSNQNTCCSADADCSDGETKCTTDTCVSKTCVHTPTGAAGCCISDIWSNTFDTNDAMGIVFSNSAGVGLGWQIWLGSPQTKSPPGVLYYGDPNVGNYNLNGSANKGTATTPLIQLPGDVTSKATFDLYVDTEFGVGIDELQVSVIVGGVATVVWDKSAPTFTMKSWNAVSLDLSKYIGQQVQLRFSFDTVDAVANSTFGVAVDNLHFVAACP